MADEVMQAALAAMAGETAGQGAAPAESAPEAAEAAPAAAEPAPAPEPQQQADYWARVTELDAALRGALQENKQLRAAASNGGSAESFQRWAAANPQAAIDMVLGVLPEKAAAPAAAPAEVRLPPDIEARLARLEQLERGQQAIEERLQLSDFKAAVAADPAKYGIYNASPRRLDLAFRAYRQLGPEARHVSVDQWLEASHQAQLDELTAELGQVRQAGLFRDLFAPPPPAAAPAARAAASVPAPALGAGAGDTATQRELTEDEIIKLAARRMQGLE